MKIVVTGAGGFVGRALIGRLLDAGHHVTGLDQAIDAMPANRDCRLVIGDMGDAAVRAEALDRGCDAIVHLATVPGGAAERDPAASRRLNIDAMYDLLQEASHIGDVPRIVYASSIAIFGDPLPAEGVDDRSVVAPRLVYGMHKAMMEIAVCSMSERLEIDGVTLRLPGIVARPKGPSGLKSAFMSDLFHALRSDKAYVCPVSPGATIWAQSVEQCVDNLIHALTVDAARLPRTRAVTLPALRIRIDALIAEICRQCGSDPDKISYRPDVELEAGFGRHPALATPAARAAGFAHDGDIRSLVERALSYIAANFP